MIIFVGILLYGLSLQDAGVSVTQMTFMIIVANGCIWPLEQVFPMLNELRGSLKIFEKMTSFDQGLDPMPQGDAPFKFQSSLSLLNVNFNFDNQPILKDVTLDLEPGKKYLIKGPSGAGKSTFMKLISRTYHSYEGAIKYDQVSLPDLNGEQFNRHVAFIDQDVFLFEDTLLNNIALYHPVSSHRLNSAIKASGLTDVVASHPLGIERSLAENGLDLSGGQRQRIAIARALAKNVDILFADEATSSLNPELGAQIESTLLDLPCTLFAVSHRYYPGVTERYDAVILIKNGRVQLVETKDYFASQIQGGVA